MRILECDLGNTRCKWRLLEQGEIAGRGVFAHQQPGDWVQSIGTVDRIRVVSVAKVSVQQRFVESLQPFAVEPEFAQSEHHAAGVRCAYADPSRLGVDRWLAAVAGFHFERGAVLVLDAGTAIKADLVDAEGKHLGGYIAPGVIVTAIAEAERRIGSEFAILLTGGDGPSLIEHLTSEQFQRITLLPDLVLDGLQWVLP